MGSKRSVPLWCCRREEYRPTNHSCYARAQLAIVGHSRQYYHDGLCSSRLLLLFVRSLLWSYICFIASRPTCNSKTLRLCKCCQCYFFCLHWWRFAMAFLLELYGQIYLGGSIGAGIQKKLGRLLRSWSMLFLCISSIQSISMRLSSITSTCFLAFSTVLMTYFGMNYFLGGMHSYAQQMDRKRLALSIKALSLQSQKQF